MSRIAVFFVFAFPLLLGLSPFSGSQEKPSSEKDETPEIEIRKLVKNLGNAENLVTEDAMKQLEMLGKGALEALYEAAKKGDAKTGKRAQLLITRIEWRVLPSKKENEMQFRLAVFKKRPFPKKREKKKINNNLEDKNISGKVRHFSPRGINIILTDSGGKR